jgi:hypothetical protein
MAPPMDHDTPNPDSDDLEAELQRLLAAEGGSVDFCLKHHLRTCDCCFAVSLLVTALRRDLWMIHESRGS